MNIRNYIEKVIINEHAYKSFHNGYSLSVSDLPKNDLENLLDVLFKHDYHTRDLILDRMQELIDERMPFVESQARYDAGYRPVQDQTDGSINWVARRGAI